MDIELENNIMAKAMEMLVEENKRLKADLMSADLKILKLAFKVDELNKKVEQVTTVEKIKHFSFTCRPKITKMLYPNEKLDSALDSPNPELEHLIYNSK